jgi:hypothetical protein
VFFECGDKTDSYLCSLEPYKFLSRYKLFLNKKMKMFDIHVVV